MVLVRRQGDFILTISDDEQETNAVTTSKNAQQPAKSAPGQPASQALPRNDVDRAALLRETLPVYRSLVAPPSQQPSQQPQAQQPQSSNTTTARATARPTAKSAPQNPKTARSTAAPAASDDDEEFELVGEQTRSAAAARLQRAQLKKRKNQGKDSNNNDGDNDDDDDGEPAFTFSLDSSASDRVNELRARNEAKYGVQSTTMLNSRIQDRIDMRKFYREQRRERGEQVSSDDDDDDDDGDADDDDGDDDDEDDEDDEDEDEDDEKAEEDADDGEKDEADADADDDDMDMDNADDNNESAPTKPTTNNNAYASDDEDAPFVPRVTEHKVDRQLVHATFDALRLSRPVMRALAEMGYVRPTPVQSNVIPVAVLGRDVLVNAQTGSGKTAAFLLPIIERLLYRPKRMAVSRVVVLLPTRELAVQCYEVAGKLLRYTDLRVALVVGGMSLQTQEQELKQRPDIVLATPGRLIDHLRNTQTVHLEDVEILVLDEADRLLDMGFADELNEIVRSCPRQRQTMLFSATLSTKVSDLIMLSMRDPVKIVVDAYESIVERLVQEFVRIKANHDDDREAIVLALCKRTFITRTMIFCASKVSCHRLMILFGLFNLRAAELSGNLTQAQRQEALESFRTGHVDFLLCTDLAARGLDVDGVETVINVTMPRDTRLYVHRVGRTARAGRAGRAVTLVGEADRKTLKELVKKSRKEVVQSRVVPSEVVAKWRERLESREPDVEAILAEERVEKAQRVAEMEVNKVHNMMEHEREILTRPQRTWFQTQQQRETSKLVDAHQYGFAVSGRARPLNVDEASHLERLRKLGRRDDDDDEDDEDDDGEDRSEVLASGKRFALEESQKAAAKKKKMGVDAGDEKGKHKSKNPFRGLNRDQKRRKVMRMDAEKAAAQRLREARAEDPAASVKYVDPIKQAGVLARSAKREVGRKRRREADAEAKGTTASSKRRKRTVMTSEKDDAVVRRFADEPRLPKRFRGGADGRRGGGDDDNDGGSSSRARSKKPRGRAAESSSGGGGSSASTDRKPTRKPKKPTGFKSKSKHKRR